MWIHVGSFLFLIPLLFISTVSRHVNPFSIFGLFVLYHFLTSFRMKICVLVQILWAIAFIRWPTGDMLQF